MRKGDSKDIKRENKRLGCVIYLRITSQTPHWLSQIFVDFQFSPACFTPTSQHLAVTSMCQQYHPQSSLLSRTAGGGLAHDRGIINFPEWQTLDVWWAVLSHPLLGVPQPPSLLTVNLCLLHPPSQAVVCGFHTLDAQSRVNDRTHSQFQHRGCAARLLIFMFVICIKWLY